jgi:hypothetical protein
MRVSVALATHLSFISSGVLIISNARLREILSLTLPEALELLGAGEAVSRN